MVAGFQEGAQEEVPAQEQEGREGGERPYYGLVGGGLVVG